MNRTVIAVIAASALGVGAAHSATRAPVTSVNKHNNGADLTPVSLCVTSTMKFVRHTRKKLALAQDRYCRDEDWQINSLETDGKNLFWRVPFSGKDAEGKPTAGGAGDVFCQCRKR